MPERTTFMNVEMKIAGKQEVLAAIEAATPENPVRLATVNPEFIVSAQTNPTFRASLADMSHCTIDGAGLYFSFLLRNLLQGTTPKVERYSGANLAEDLFRRHQHGEKKFFFLGGQPGVAEEAAKNIRKTYPQIKIVGTNDGGMVDTKHIVLYKNILEELASSQPDILMVCFGAPKQELWISAAAKKVNVPTMLGLGGTFDFYGQKKRAPAWVQRLYLEWLYRGLTEKAHWKRVINATIVFPWKTLLWLLGEK